MGKFEFTPENELERNLRIFSKVFDVPLEQARVLFHRSGLDQEIKENYCSYGYYKYRESVNVYRRYLNQHGFECPEQVIEP